LDIRLKLAGLVAGALLAAGCSSPSVQEQAMEASSSGDQKKAITLARQDIERFGASDQCSPTVKVNCGTLALAYSTVAQYQILDGDWRAGERSFQAAKRTLPMVEPANKPSATAMVYRDVSEAYWKVGNKPRAVAVFNEGREAGGDVWLYSSSAASIADGGNPVKPPGAPDGAPAPEATPPAAPTPVSAPAATPAPAPPRAPPVIVPATPPPGGLPPGGLPPGLPSGTSPGRT
jgi:hypothetical protein